jgi:hypothetical protein
MGKQNSELSLMYEYIQSVSNLIEEAAAAAAACRERNQLHPILHIQVSQKAVEILLTFQPY